MVGVHTHKPSLQRGITHLSARHAMATDIFPHPESQDFTSLRKDIYQMLLFFSRSRFYSVYYLFYIFLVPIDSR